MINFSSGNEVSILNLFSLLEYYDGWGEKTSIQSETVLLDLFNDMKSIFKLLMGRINLVLSLLYFLFIDMMGIIQICGSPSCLPFSI